MAGNTEGRVQRAIKCPRCGTVNLSTEAACTNCGESLHSNKKSSIPALIPAIIAAGSFTFFSGVGCLCHGLTWESPYIALSIIQHINPGEALGVAMAFLFLIALYNGPLLTSGIILIVLGLKKR